MSDSRVSSFCHLGNCVEVHFIEREQVQVANSTGPWRYVVFTHDEWRAFVLGVKAGEFDV